MVGVKFYPPATAPKTYIFHIRAEADGTYCGEQTITIEVPTQHPDDTTPPTTRLRGPAKWMCGQNYVSPDTLFTIKASDTGSGIHSTSYRIFNTTYSSGWLIYTDPSSTH